MMEFRRDGAMYNNLLYVLFWCDVLCPYHDSVSTAYTCKYIAVFRELSWFLTHLLNYCCSGGDCDVVLEETPSLLLVTFVVCLFASFFMLLFSCVTCGSVCCPTKCCGPADEGDAPWTDLEGDTQGEMTHVGVKANSIPLPEKNIV